MRGGGAEGGVAMSQVFARLFSPCFWARWAVASVLRRLAEAIAPR